jgi:hypothetical protein
MYVPVARPPLGLALVSGSDASGGANGLATPCVLADGDGTNTTKAAAETAAQSH